jgi:hypothetical protein
MSSTMTILFFQYISSMFCQYKFNHRMVYIFCDSGNHWVAVIVDNPSAAIHETKSRDDDDYDDDDDRSTTGQSGVNQGNNDSDTMGPESEEEDTETDDQAGHT